MDVSNESLAKPPFKKGNGAKREIERDSEFTPILIDGGQSATAHSFNLLCSTTYLINRDTLLQSNHFGVFSVLFPSSFSRAIHCCIVFFSFIAVSSPIGECYHIVLLTFNTSNLSWSPRAFSRTPYISVIVFVNALSFDRWWENRRQNTKRRWRNEWSKILFPFQVYMAIALQRIIAQ